MKVTEVFRKQGGFRLIGQYLRSGAFFTAAMQFLLLGRSRTALEILRLSASLKTRKKLNKKYRKSLEAFHERYQEPPHVSSGKIFICWFQGMEQAPEIVKTCYASVKAALPDREIVLISQENMYDHVQFPPHVQEKIDSGIITRTHLSDLLRLELLLKYGGTWIDATVFCSGGRIPDYMLHSDLFTFQLLKPGRDGKSSVISSWFITATSGNRILAATRHLLYEYWKKNTKLVDYFLLHDFFQMALEKYSDDWNRVVPFSSATPHILLLRLFQPYDETLWNAVTSQTPFHKLSYKFSDSDAQKENTYYQHILHS